ncbi:hypothetical protein RRG08_037383 [Elysia crispata]|uniref:Uncharacterized protein n=1 Tax=Elysia crispata TaxID=231223 RepID=A0AAE1AG02_9GAST|nr:hypothetical protein RRG08_037383 [Elysia crispata]
MIAVTRMGSKRLASWGELGRGCQFARCTPLYTTEKRIIIILWHPKPRSSFLASQEDIGFSVARQDVSLNIYWFLPVQSPSCPSPALFDTQTKQVECLEGKETRQAGETQI